MIPYPLKTYTEQNQGQTIEAQLGDEVEVALLENPTAGFRWHFVHPGDPVCILLKDAFKPGTAAVGQGGIHSWVFKVTATGTSKIELAYGRSWHPGEIATRTFALYLKSL